MQAPVTDMGTVMVTAITTVIGTGTAITMDIIMATGIGITVTITAITMVTIITITFMGDLFTGSRQCRSTGPTATQAIAFTTLAQAFRLELGFNAPDEPVLAQIAASTIHLGNLS